MLCSPQRILDLAGPTQSDREPGSPESPTEQRKSDLDLFRLIMDGIQEASHCSDGSVCSASVACTVTLLGTLEDLSNGRGLNDEHVEIIGKIKEPDNWQEIYTDKNDYDNAASARPPTLISCNLEDSDEEDEEGHKKIKPKHIRWSMDLTHNETSDSDDENHSFSLPKTVTWAPENEEHIIENREDLQALKTTTQRNRARQGSNRRTGIPRANPRNTAYSDIKPRTDSGLHSTKAGKIPKPLKRSVSADPKALLATAEQKLHRSSSSIDIRPKRTRYPLSSATFPLRRFKSLEDLFTSYPRRHLKSVKVDHEFFEQTLKNRIKSGRGAMKRARASLGFPRIGIEATKAGRRIHFVGTDLDKTDKENANRLPRPILRRGSKQSTEGDKQRPTELEDKSKSKSENEKRQAEIDQGKKVPKWEIPKSPSKETTINGIPLSKLPRQGGKATSKVKSPPKVDEEEKRSIEEDEKEGARNFARCLLGILPSVLTLTEPQAADQALQQFASDVCEAVCCMALKRKNVPNFGTLRRIYEDGEELDCCEPVLNADGAYVTVMETLILNYKLNKIGYYKKKGVALPLTQDEFVDNILNSGIQVNLSRVWLGEVYRLVTTYDILTKAGYKPDSPETNRSLISLLSGNLFTNSPARITDPEKSGFVLSSPDQENIPIAKKEGMKFARRLLLATWDSVLEVLGVPLDTSTKIIAGNGSVGIAVMLGIDGQKDNLVRERDMIYLSLDGLRRAARLCCTLGIQARCETVLSRLAEASCGYFMHERKLKTLHLSGPLRLHAAHVLSMDALLGAGLELGAHAPKCWVHVFKCCMYISHLEHAHFNFSETSSVASLSLPIKPISDLSPASDVDSISECDTSLDFSDVNSENKSSAYNGILAPEDASRAVYALSSAVDNLFETASNTLTLKALLEFLEALISASKEQLFGKSTDRRLSLDIPGVPPMPPEPPGPQLIAMNTLHLYHICDVMLRSARNNNRPLLHLMKAWAIVSPHLIEAAFHRGRHVSKVALTSTHDILSEMLKRRNELPHFWFHESLFKPFDSLLSFEVYDDDIQDQVLYTLYELVEGFASSIKSGWRTLFGALRNIQVYHRRSFEGFDDGDQRQNLLFSIIENFINTKSTAVFASAAVDCILCLLRFLRGSNAIDNALNDINDDSKSETESVGSENNPNHELCIPALQALSQISKRLASVYIQPASTIFHAAHSIILVDLTQTHDKVWDDNWSNNSGSSTSDSELKLSSSTAKSIMAIDDTGILRVWFLLLEGLTSAVNTCPRRFQAQTIDCLFEILRSIATVPGPHFSMFATTHLLLPMLQNWVQRGSKHRSHWESTLHNFKHACGQATQLVVEEIGHFLSVEGASECVPTMIRLLLDLYIECVSQPTEAIARLGCSCLRHLLLSAGPQFPEELWHNVCKGIKKIISATLSDLKELIVCFQPGSTSVSGDNGMHVKVVARRDSAAQDTQRQQQIAEQVFQLESQICSSSPRKLADHNSEEDDQRSYIFVIGMTDAKDKPETSKARIPFKSVVVSLLANQILLHTLGSMLLENSDASSSMPTTMLASVTDSGLIQTNQDDSSENQLPGLLCYLSPANLSILFDCLQEAQSVANDFNSRHGLRALIQKLAKLPAPANLLRQSITSFAYYLNTLFQISRHDGENYSISHIKRILTGEKASLEANDSKRLVKDEENVSSTVPDRHRDLLKGDRNVDWIIRRLYEACNQLSSIYLKLHASEIFEHDSGFESFSNSFSTPLSSPFKAFWRPRASSSEESLESLRPPRRLQTEWNAKQDSPNRFPRLKEEDTKFVEQDSRDSSVSLNKQQQQQLLKRKEDELTHLNAWTQLVMNMLELLMALPTLQFKAVLPAVFPSVTSLITTVHEQRVRQLVCDVVRRCGAIYGII